MQNSNLISENLVVPEIETILQYKNLNVIKKFNAQFPVSIEESEDIFVELMKWLWLCSNHYHDIKLGKKDSQMIVSFGGTRIIDEMWHTFILFTYDYELFCKKYFNHFIHHFPEVPQIGEEAKLSKEDARKMMKHVYEYLGEETSYKWYVLYQEKYSIEQLSSLHRF